MAVSKVAYDGHTLIDLTQDTAVESDVADGKYFHKSNGERVQGTSGKVIVQGSDSSAFLIRPTAGETLAPLDCDRKSVLKKLGNTVGVNQLVQNGDFSNGTTNWAVFDSALASISASSGVLTETIAGGTRTDAYKYGIMQNIPRLITGHTHITIITVNPSVATTFRLELGGAGAVDTLEISTKTTLFLVSNVASYNTRLLFYPRSAVNNVVAPAMTIQYENIHTHDLTRWFGNTDRIPSDLLSHPENWGRYYAGSLAHNAGTLESADGSVMRSIGRNIWNENWQYSNTLFGAWCIESVDIILVSPNSEIYAYCSRVNFASRGLWFAFYDAEGNLLRKERIYGTTFTMPSDAHGIRIGILTTYYGETVYKFDTTLSLYYPGESGYSEYYPHSVLAEVDTGSEVLRSAGAVADEKTPDGTITRRVGVVDLGTLTWAYDGRFYAPLPLAEPTQGKTEVNGACGRYVWGNNYNTAPDKSFFISSTKNLSIWDSAYTDAATFKTAMSGIYLYYELATPTTEQGTAFTGLQKVDGHGTEMVTGGTTGIPVPFVAQYLKTINAAPTDTIVITENGSHDVAMYAGAIVDVSGGGTPSLQSKTVNLDSNAPSTVYPGTGYNGLSSVAFNTAGINAANIKAGTSVCGVLGTYAALTYDVQTRTPPILGPGVTPVDFVTGWRPGVIVFEWTETYEDTETGELVTDHRRAALADTGSIIPEHDTVTFTSTGYSILMDGTYWNDASERFGSMTITAIKLC